MDKGSVKHILYLSYDGMTDPLGQSQVLPYLVGLSNKGFKFSLLSFEKKVNSDNEKIINEIINTVDISWFPQSYSKRPPVLSTIWDIIKMYNASKRILKKNPYVIVHCRSYVAALVGLKLKKKFGIKFVFDMRGFWVDERVEGGIWKLSNPFYKLIYRFFKEKESYFFNDSDYIISLTQAGKEEIISNYLSKNVPIEVIPCCVNSDLFDYKTVNHNRQIGLQSTLKLDTDNFIISYLGSIGTWYMLDEMLEFFKELLNKKPNAIFLFITADNPLIIERKASELGINKNQIRITKVTRKEVPDYLALSDVALFFIKPVYSKIASSPTKLAEIMAMGIPIICNDNVGDIKSIVNDEVGYVINQFTKSEYQNAIRKIPRLMQKDKLKIRNQSIRQFNLDRGIDKYANAYNKLV
ncbi:glycosyltransferase [Fulvivirga lutea]|uniref:Glycosyltransferase n=1 Tax=Fulvivirga lutea TaxID=2810512 RepID=A0A974WLJ9_9BACT|nr:glycosyltransferase [Fulvivirga lutea]QSE98450.1 glycosyltransferase [Fulvivirga lutea]